MKNKPTLEQLTPLIERAVQPVAVSGYGKLRDAALAGRAWLERAAEAIANKTTMGEHTRFPNFVFWDGPCIDIVIYSESCGLDACCYSGKEELTSLHFPPAE